MTALDTAISSASTTPETVTPDTTSPPASTQKETFSREYVAELRAENENWQQRHQKALSELNKIRQDTQQQLSQTQQSARERIIRAEMKALALKAGLRDWDCLKLLDMSSIQLKEDDTLEGAQAALAGLKEAKPFLFSEWAASSSAPSTPPTPKDAQPTDVSQLSPDEYARRKATYLRTALQKAI